VILELLKWIIKTNVHHVILKMDGYKDQIKHVNVQIYSILIKVILAKLVKILYLDVVNAH